MSLVNNTLGSFLGGNGTAILLTFEKFRERPLTWGKCFLIPSIVDFLPSWTIDDMLESQASP